MKLLIITQKVDVGDDVMGFSHRWIEAIAKHTQHTYVIANAVGTHALPHNVSVYSLGKEHHRARLLRYMVFYWHALKLLPKVDGVFVHMCPEYVVILHPLNMVFRKPVTMWYAHIKVSRIARWAIKRVRRILSPSTESFSLPTEKLVGTGHGIDTDYFVPPKNKQQHARTHILSVGRISYVKDTMILIEALHVLVHRYGVTAVIVRIAGAPARPEDHAYLAELKKKARAYDIEKYIEWMGAVRNDDTLDLYQDADIFVRMQKGGGFGKVELEAMACGVPTVLCTPVYNTQLGEFSQDVYWHEGNADEFAQKLLAVMEWDEAKRARYAKLSRSIVVEGHNLNHLAKKIASSFHD